MCDICQGVDPDNPAPDVNPPVTELPAPQRKGATSVIDEQRTVEATEGWSALEFYAFIVRTLGIPDTFRLGEKGWVADAPFTKASLETLALLESHGV